MNYGPISDQQGVVSSYLVQLVFHGASGHTSTVSVVVMIMPPTIRRLRVMTPVGIPHHQAQPSPYQRRLPEPFLALHTSTPAIEVA